MWGRVKTTKGKGLADKPETASSVLRDKTRYPRWTEAMVDALAPYRERGRKWFQLYDKVADERTLKSAWERIDARVAGEARSRGAGVDGVTVEMFSRTAGQAIPALAAALKEGGYQPAPVKRHWIPKPGTGKKRPLGLPTVADRVVQEAARGMIEPIWEAQFLDGSHGFRPGRSTDTACLLLEEYLASGRVWIVDADITGCFDNISHEAVAQMLYRHIADSKMLGLIEAMLKAGVMEEWTRRRTAAGTPQGGIISPLLCNIVLHEMDTRLESKGIKWVRYADDFVLACETREQAESAMQVAALALAPLGLQLHPGKTRIVHMEEGFDFLGWHYEGTRRRPRDKTVKSIRRRIAETTRRNRPDAIEKICDELRPLLQGVFNYFRNGNSAFTFSRLDGYIRRRLRSILRKRKRGGGISGGLDHILWPNVYFSNNGLFSFVEHLHLHRAKPYHSPAGG